MHLAKMNSRTTMDKFKKGLKLQEFLNTCVVGSSNMACDDMRWYLSAKCPIVDRSFIDMVQNAFVEGEELDFTHFLSHPSFFEPI